MTYQYIANNKNNKISNMTIKVYSVYFMFKSFTHLSICKNVQFILWSFNIQVLIINKLFKFLNFVEYSNTLK